MPVTLAYGLLPSTEKFGRLHDVRRISRDGRRRRSRASAGAERRRHFRRLVDATDRFALGADERLLRIGRARRLHPCAPRLCARQRRDRWRFRSGRRARGPVDAVLPVASLPEGRRRGRSQDPFDRAHVGAFRHASARHDPHTSARPPGVHHRLDQSAQRQARGRPLLARGLYPAYHRLRALHWRGLPHRCSLSADGLGACGDGGHGARAQRAPAGEPHA